MHSAVAEQLGRLYTQKATGLVADDEFLVQSHTLLKEAASLGMIPQIKIPSFQAKVQTPKPKQPKMPETPKYKGPREFVHPSANIPHTTMTQDATQVIETAVKPIEPVDRMRALQQYTQTL